MGSSQMEAQPRPGDVTCLLHAWRGGDEAAQEELWQRLYGELRNLAQGVLHRHGRHRPKHRTSLVHEAFLRLVDSDVEWRDRGHFFAVAARAMRFVLVDEARRQLAGKRGDGAILHLGEKTVRLPERSDHRPEEVLAVHQALGRLGQSHPRQEKLVELRYFAGLSVEEAAEVLEVTPRTVVRDWRAARDWLAGELRAS